MKKLITYGFALLMVSTIVTSCSKYEEGPNFALSSKKARLTGDWKLTAVNENGTDQNISSYQTTVSINKDESFKQTVTYTVFGVPNTIEVTGTWKFNDDKTKLLITTSGQNTADEYIIVRLASKELKLKQVEGSNFQIKTYESN